MGYNGLRDQVKTYTDDFNGEYVLLEQFDTQVNPSPRLEAFAEDTNLRSMKMRELNSNELATPSCLERKQFECITNEAAKHKLHLTFESVDTEELKNLAFSFEGDQGIFKVGEGESNHY